jgi:hypothetical protein
MRRLRFTRLAIVASACVLVWIQATAHAKGKDLVSAAQRRALLKHAQVWHPTDVASMNLRTGPTIKGAFAPGETITCDYVDEKFGGHTPKFGCVRPPDDHLKVRYGRENGEVYAFVAATRLLWALGFGADAAYPVHIICRGCPEEIHGDTEAPPGETHFDIAMIERKFPGRDLNASSTGPGWSWPDLDLVDERAGGAPLAQRDALKLLAVMLQHTDSKADQQRLVCLDKEKDKEKKASRDDLAACDEPFMMIHDVGLTFGSANLFNRGDLGSVNFERWSAVRVWRDAAHCVGNLTTSQTGTLEHPVISEGGRKFLADRLGQLSDTQITDMFQVARFSERPLPKGVGGSPIEAWVDAFKKKRDEIATVTCP